MCYGTERYTVITNVHTVGMSGQRNNSEVLRRLLGIISILLFGRRDVDGNV